MSLFAGLGVSLLSGLVAGYAATAASELTTRPLAKVDARATSLSLPSSPLHDDQHATVTHIATRHDAQVQVDALRNVGGVAVVMTQRPDDELAPYDIVLPPRAVTSQQQQQQSSPQQPSARAMTTAADVHDVSLWARFAQQCRDAAVHGLPSSEHVRCYGSYLAGLNYERRIPSWVLERIDGTQLRRHGRRVYKTTTNSSNSSSSSSSADDSEAEVTATPPSPPHDTDTHTTSKQHAQPTATSASRRRSAFYADTTVPELFRVQPSDYATRGLSRGHLAAAQLHTNTQDDLDATFNMSANIVPQDMTVNALDWARLEHLTRRLSEELSGVQQQQQQQQQQTHTKSSSSGSSGNNKSDSRAARGRLYVVSGPVFLPRWVCPSLRRADGGTDLEVDVAPSAHMARLVVQHELTGPLAQREHAGIAVPTHLYKVLLAEYDDDVASDKQTQQQQQQQHRQQEGQSSSSSRYTLAAFLMPNTPIANEQPLTAYQVPVTRIEQATGLRFFPRLPTHTLPDLCATHTCDAASPEYVKDYRHVARLRRAQSIAELNRAYAAIKGSVMADGGAVSKRVVREHERRREELAAMAVRPFEEA